MARATIDIFPAEQSRVPPDRLGLSILAQIDRERGRRILDGAIKERDELLAPPPAPETDPKIVRLREQQAALRQESDALDLSLKSWDSDPERLPELRTWSSYGEFFARINEQRNAVREKLEAVQSELSVALSAEEREDLNRRIRHHQERRARIIEHRRKVTEAVAALVMKTLPDELLSSLLASEMASRRDAF
jgi:hypothetical protein